MFYLQLLHKYTDITAHHHNKGNEVKMRERSYYDANQSSYSSYITSLLSITYIHHHIKKENLLIVYVKIHTVGIVEV